MKSSVRATIFGFATTFLLACQSESTPPQLSPPEVFDWSGQPVSFSGPPEGWRRERSQNGGEEGVRFVKSGSVGEEIHVSERFFLGKRDRCSTLQALMDEAGNLDVQTFEQRLQLARLYAKPALVIGETTRVRAANAHLDQARRSFRSGHPVVAQRAIAAALKEAQHIRYEIGGVVDKVIYSADQMTLRHVTATSEEPVPAELAGEPAISVDYTLEYSGRVYAGRRVYAVKNNRLFEVGFQGLEENLPLFERVLETVSFPPGECEH